MTTVNMHEAKSQLSKLVRAVETGTESEVILTRDGRPVAKLVPLTSHDVDVSKRLGLAEGQFGDFSLDEFNAGEDEIAALFYDVSIDPEQVVVPPRRKKSA